MEITEFARINYSVGDINNLLKKAENSITKDAASVLIAAALVDINNSITLIKTDILALLAALEENEEDTPSNPSGEQQNGNTGESGETSGGAGTEDPSNTESTYYLNNYLNLYTHSVPELSSLCINSTGDGLYGVSDRGPIYKVSFTGESSELNNTINTDNEGITINPTTKDIYYCVERLQLINKLAAPDYVTVTTEATIDGIATEENKGFEGIAYYKDDIFFVGNLNNPCKLIQYSLANGIVSEKDITCTNEIADLKWDGENLWILDSTNGDLCKCDINGNCSIRYKINFPGVNNVEENFESFEIINNTLYVASEESKLFVINLDNYSETPEIA